VSAGKALTARTVETAKPKRNGAGATVRTEMPDAACLGLYLVVQPTGARSWALRYRNQGKPAKLTLGAAGVGGLTLAAARVAAAKARHQLEQGAVPVPISAAPHDDRIEAQVASFLAKHVAKNRTAATTESIFNRLVLPAWRGRAVRDIRRRDVIDLVEQIADERGGVMANRTLSALSKFYRWLVGRDVLETSPVAGVERPYKEVARDRTLTDAELRKLWLACDGDGPFGAAVQFMALTGGRRNEVSRMTWGEIDEERRTWTLPKARSKNGHEHEIALSTQAWAIIGAMPRFAGCDYVFSADGRGPIAGWSKPKTRFSAKADLPEESWRLHDLRRTCAAGMQKLGVAVPVIERALNHQSGVFRGIVGTYQVHPYRDEGAAALQAWGNRVDEIVSGRAAKVVPLRGGRRR
jgi:integrase